MERRKLEAHVIKCKLETLFCSLLVHYKPYLSRSESDFTAASSATANVTVVTSVTETVCKLGLETELASGVELSSGFPLLLTPLPNGRLQ